MRTLPPQREHFIPQGAREEIIDAGLGLVAYRHENKGHPVAILFGGKRQKPDQHFRYRSVEQRERDIAAWADGQRKRAQAMADLKTSRATFTMPEVGAIYLNSWGWEQTNIDFYQVVAVHEKILTLRPIAGTFDETPAPSAMAAYVIPIPDKFTGPEFTKRPSGYNGHAYLSFPHGGGGWHKPGEHHYCSWYG